MNQIVEVLVVEVESKKPTKKDLPRSVIYKKILSKDTLITESQDGLRSKTLGDYAKANPQQDMSLIRVLIKIF